MGLSAELRECVRPLGVCVGLVPAALMHMLASVSTLDADGEALILRAVWQGGAIYALVSFQVFSTRFDSNTAGHGAAIWLERIRP